ncbi:hypothetical protein PHLCEN_2v4695 [Hermanssonia centrifuga]|uniref:Uncharacterized protein n=1 Tax=Hermanssonia centrifuga TaxID=98765 RepID=A0A2R6PN15_9APHY|nr:hypothetical protein PHLCEN_2v4695 [Hermanssonia centrifuga]
MASTTPVPEHKLSESPNSRSIAVGDWTVTARTNPISNAVECDALQIALLGMPLPEMTFGNNSLELKHQPSGWNYVFTTMDALKSVKNGELTEGDGGVKVGYADAWLQSRSTGPLSQVPMPKTAPTKPYDWTYTTMYPGHALASSSSLISWQTADSDNPSHTIPLAELTRQDPILFYAEIPLFEDELHDNGASHLLVRIRLHRRDDLTPLTDPMWIAKALTDLPPEATQTSGAGTKWRGLGTKLDVATLVQQK